MLRLQWIFQKIKIFLGLHKTINSIWDNSLSVCVRTQRFSIYTNSHMQIAYKLFICICIWWMGMPFKLCEYGITAQHTQNLTSGLSSFTFLRFVFSESLLIRMLIVFHKLTFKVHLRQKIEPSLENCYAMTYYEFRRGFSQ